MLECKAMDVDLTQQTVEQIVRYNMSVPVSFLVVSNGSYTYAWQKTEHAFESIDRLPAFL
jgi:predicted type IV restriction endonuclease